MKKLLYIISCIFIFNTCSYVLENYDDTADKNYLSIQAELSNIEGASFVNIEYSSVKTVTDVVLTPVQKAKVYFIDNAGKKELLNEISYGYYKPSTGFKGEIGKTYKLRIETTEGGIYESTTETMGAIVPVDSVYDEFEERTNYPVGTSGRYIFNVYLDFKDSPKTDEYYQWVTTHYAKLLYCKKCTNTQWNATTQQCQRQVFRTRTYIYGCREDCFSIDVTPDIFLLSDKNVNGNTIKRQKLGFAPIEDLTRYYLLIEQRRLTESAFNYLNALKEARAGGTFFDVPALTRFSTNIKSLSNPSEKIIGVWNVFSAVQKPLVIERSKVTIKEYTPQPPFEDGIFETPPLIFFPCEESATQTKAIPPGWK